MNAEEFFIGKFGSRYNLIVKFMNIIEKKHEKNDLYFSFSIKHELYLDCECCLGLLWKFLCNLLLC
jgi:hypothetical protein